MKVVDFILIAILFSLSLFLLTRYINKPFWGHHDWNSNIWTLTAKNNLKYGILCTKLGQATTAKPIENCRELQYYMDHPPLLTWLLTISYFIWGFSEAVGRLPFILCSTISILLIFLIGRKLYNRQVGFFAGLFSIATPMFCYFGKSINHEPVVLFSVLFSVYSYILWIKDGNKGFYYWYLLSTLITGISGWQGYFIYPLLTFTTFFYQRKSFKKSIVPLFMLAIIFFLHQIHTFFVNGAFNFGLIFQFLRRTNLVQEANIEIQITQFSYKRFFIQELRWLMIYYTRLLILGAIIFLLLTLKDFRKKRLTFSTIIIWVFLVFGVIPPLLFSEQAFIHDYLNIYLLPFFALSTAAALGNLKKVLNKRLILYFSLILAVGIFFERKSFLDALQKGQAGKSYVELAQIINQKSENRKRFLIEANNFYNFAYPFLWNYAYHQFIDERTDNLASFWKQRSEIEKTYNYIVTIETNPVESDLEEFFDKNYQKEKMGIFSFYKL